ncbi:MAG: hypothetical protein MUC67_10540, partial [Acidobacteria bacterium]|nr:hypothetical protein [Acidobacteriota bacterium]
MPGESERETPPERPRGRLRRALRVLLLAVPGLFLFYLLAANVLLQTPLVEALVNKRPERLRITYRQAFTFFPGHVLAQGVVVRNQASRSQLQISAEKVWAVVNPLPLFANEVRIVASKVWGPKVWLRSRPETEEERLASEPFVPPIEGLPFSLRVPRRVLRPSPWKVVVESVEVFEVREFWYQFLRVEGPGTVNGAFTIGPASLVEVRWERCDFPALRLLYRNGTVLPDAELHSTGRITPFDSRSDDTTVLMPHFSGRADVRATAPAGIAALRPFLAGVKGLALSGDPLQLAAAVRMESGALAPGTRIDLETARAAAVYRGMQAQGAIRLAVAVAEDGPATALGHPLRLELALDGLSARAEGRETASAAVRAVRLDARIPGSSLAAPPRHGALDLTVSGLRIEDALDFPLLRGERPAARLDLALEGDARATAEYARSADDAMTVRWGPFELTGLAARADGRPVVTEGHLSSSGSVGPVPLAGPASRDWASTIAGRVDVDLLAGPDLSALQPLLGRTAGVVLSGGPARVSMTTAVAAGKATRTTLALRADRVGLRAGRGVAARGAIALEAALEGDGAAAADVRLRGLELQLAGRAGADGVAAVSAIRGDAATLKLRGAGVTFRALPREVAVEALLSGLAYDGALGPRGAALSASVPGPVRVDAAAAIAPHGAVRLRWGPLEVPGLAVRLDGQPLLDDLRLATSGTLGPFALSGAVDGRRLLETASGRLALDAAAPPGLPGVRALLPSDSPVALGGAGARLAAEVTLQNGNILPGSRVSLRSDALEVSSAGVVAQASVDMAARVGPGEELALETTLGDLRVAHQGADSAAGRGERVALVVPRKALDFELALTDLNLDDVTRLDDPLPQKVQEDIGPDDLRLDLALGGTARVAGNLALGPGSEFLLDCDTVDFPYFELDVDGTALFERATLTGHATLGPYDFGARGRGGILPVTSGRALLTGRTAAGLRALDNLLRSVAWLEIDGGMGFVTLEAVAEKGSLKPGSSATLQLADLALTVTDFRAGGDADVRAWIGSDAGGEFAALESRLANVRVSRKGTEGLVEAEGVTLTARTRELQLGKAPKDVEVKLTLENARLDTIVGLNGLLPKGTGVVFTDGSAHVDAEL